MVWYCAKTQCWRLVFKIKKSNNGPTLKDQNQYNVQLGNEFAKNTLHFNFSHTETRKVFQ